MSKKIVFIKTVEDKTGLTRQSIWRYLQANKFPLPTKIGNRNAWLESSIDAWIDEKIGDNNV